MALPAYPSLPGLAYPVGRTMVWSTLNQDSWSGKSAPIQVWSFPRRKYALTYEFLRSQADYNQSVAGYAEWETLEAFFGSVGGAANPFLFTDVTDQTAAAMVFGIGDGVTTTFQLLRSLAKQTYAEPVYAPRAGFVVNVNGAATTNFAIGGNPGQIIFPSAPANGAILTWTGGFDWICRFDDDTMEFQQFMSGFYSAAKIGFTTVKL